MANNRLRQCLGIEKIKWGVGMLEAESSVRHFARHLGVSQNVVAKIWNHFQTQGNVVYRHGEGLQRATMNADDHLIQLSRREIEFQVKR